MNEMSVLMMRRLSSIDNLNSFFILSVHAFFTVICVIIAIITLKPFTVLLLDEQAIFSSLPFRLLSSIPTCHLTFYSFIHCKHKKHSEKNSFSIALLNLKHFYPATCHPLTPTMKARKKLLLNFPSPGLRALIKNE